jgi:hypothetical protein
MITKENAIRIETKEYGKTKKKQKVYIFKCSDCDNEIRLQGGHFKYHSGKCKRCSRLTKPYLYIYNELLRRADPRYKVELSYEQFLEIIKDKLCHYCEKPLTFEEYSRNWGKRAETKAYQLDRKDNNLGYTFDNSVCCCWTCNQIKSNVFSYEEFLKLAPVLKEIRLNKN